jgi:hypothetical protein
MLARSLRTAATALALPLLASGCGKGKDGAAAAVPTDASSSAEAARADTVDSTVTVDTQAIPGTDTTQQQPAD